MAGLQTDTARQHLRDRDEALRAALREQERALRGFFPHEGSDLKDKLIAGLKDQSTTPQDPGTDTLFKKAASTVSESPSSPRTGGRSSGAAEPFKKASSTASPSQPSSQAGGAKEYRMATCEILAMGTEELFNRPCVDCGRVTEGFCDYCYAAHRIPTEKLPQGQMTPLCSECDTRFHCCRFCRGVAGPRPDAHFRMPGRQELPRQQER